MSENDTKLLSIVFIITFLAVLYAFKDKERFDILKKDFTNPLFLFFITIIIIICITGIAKGSSKTRKAIEHAAIAFIIAYLSRLNMVFLAFFIVGAFVYFIGSGVS